MNPSGRLPWSSRNKTLELSSSLRKRGQEGGTMTLPKLLAICRENGSPTNPLAVTRLELNCQLFTEINECIAEFAEVEQLLLNQNKIQKICHLDKLQHLSCLYLQHNRLLHIEGLSKLSALRILDVSHNEIRQLSGLQGLPLETLLAAANQLSGVESLQHLLLCHCLSEVDVGHNRIRDPSVLQVFAGMPALQTLTLQYNPLSNAADPNNKDPPVLPNYRRTVISVCSGLTALDHKPVFAQERAYAEAWWSVQLAEAEAAEAAAEEAEEKLADEAPASAAAGAAGSGADSDTGPESSSSACSTPRLLSILSPRNRSESGTGTGPRPRISSNGSHTIPSPRCSAAAAAAGDDEAAAAAPPGLAACLSSGVLNPALACLDARGLLMASLTCRWWAQVAALRLMEVRLRAAQARMAAAAVAWADCSPLLGSLKADDITELRALVAPPRPLVQLLWALKLIWETGKQRRGGTLRRNSDLSSNGDQQLAGRSDAGGSQQGQQLQQQREEQLWEQQQQEQEVKEGNVGESQQHQSLAASRQHEHGPAGVISKQQQQQQQQHCNMEQLVATADAVAGGVAAQHAMFATGHEGDVPNREEPVVETEDSLPARLASVADNEAAAVAEAVAGAVQDSMQEGFQPSDGSAAEAEDAVADNSKPVAQNAAAVAAAAAAEEAVADVAQDAEPEELKQHFDSHTWMNQAWRSCMRILSSPAEVLEALQQAFPLSAATVVKLRARTGTADDLEVYTPLLDVSEVSRCHPPCGLLCKWLLAAQEHEHARELLAAAQAWSWPNTALLNLPNGAHPSHKQRHN